MRKELSDAGRLATTLGGLAVTLAERAEDATGTALAALSKELRTVMATALQDAEAAMDPVDELQARRDAKRA